MWVERMVVSPAGFGLKPMETTVGGGPSNP